MFPGGVTWEDAARTKGSVAEVELGRLTSDEVEALPYVIPVQPDKLALRLQELEPAGRFELGRRFLLGSQPSWEIAASDAPVSLAELRRLSNFLASETTRTKPFVVVIGQAGAGKTTATMTALVEIARKEPTVQVIEIRGDVPGLTAAVTAAEKIFKDKHIIAFISDLFPYGSRIKADIVNISRGKSQIISVARASEWASRFAKTLDEVSEIFDFGRFTRDDEPHIIAALDRFLSAPEFAKLSHEEKAQRLKASKQQLLIAMREATSSASFDKNIEEEYRRLGPDAQRLLLIIGTGTLARVGIASGIAFSAYREGRGRLTFDEAFDQLRGIVSESNSRFYARHEVYVRHIFRSVAPFREVIGAINAVLLQFSAYRNPIIINAGRLDAALFRYALNKDAIFELAFSHDVPEDGLKVYQAFEVKFQLDGHYWLQYGLYLDKLGRLDDAEAMLRKSIEAYSENLFARHALARLRLRIAARRPDYDGETREFIRLAAEELNAQDSRPGADTDMYPLVTLALFHVDALVRQNQAEDASVFAREYRERLLALQRRSPRTPLDEPINDLTMYIATGSWRAGKSGDPDTDY